MASVPVLLRLTMNLYTPNRSATASWVASLATSQWLVNKHQVTNAAFHTNNKQIAINQQMCFSETLESEEHFSDRNLSEFLSHDIREPKVLISHECSSKRDNYKKLTWNNLQNIKMRLKIIPGKFRREKPLASNFISFFVMHSLFYVNMNMCICFCIYGPCSQTSDGSLILPVRTKNRYQVWFNIKVLSDLYRISHYGDKMVDRSSYLHNGLYW